MVSDWHMRTSSSVAALKVRIESLFYMNCLTWWRCVRADISAPLVWEVDPVGQVCKVEERKS